MRNSGNDLLSSISKSAIALDEEYRRGHPYRFADRDVFYVENVARMLGCSTDQARRIPRNQLPAYSGPGKRLMYLREDVLEYIRSRPVRSSGKGLRPPPVRTAQTNDNVVPFFDASGAIIDLQEENG
jgi:hypothetical protein